MLIHSTNFLKQNDNILYRLDSFATGGQLAKSARRYEDFYYIIKTCCNL